MRQEADVSPGQAAAAAASPRQKQTLLVTVGFSGNGRPAPRSAGANWPGLWGAGALPAVIGGSERAWPAGSFVGSGFSGVALMKSIAFVCSYPEISTAVILAGKKGPFRAS